MCNGTVFTLKMDTKKEMAALLSFKEMVTFTFLLCILIVTKIVTMYT